MDTELLVDDRGYDGTRLLDQLGRDGFDVTVGFWAKTSEEGSWFLYIGSNLIIKGKAIGPAYGTLYLSLSKIPVQNLSLSEIQLIPADDPIAVAAREVRDRYPSLTPVKYRGERLGNLAIEEAYIYPSNSLYLTINAVTDVDLTNGQLRVWKRSVSLPKQEQPPDQPEWVSDVRVVGDRLTVEKVKVVQGPNGLEAEYREEVQSLPSKITKIQTSP